MLALVAAIHVFGAARKAWMAGTSPAMTATASVARMERSEIRVGIDAATSFPDFAAFHPGYTRVCRTEIHYSSVFLAWDCARILCASENLRKKRASAVVTKYS